MSSSFSKLVDIEESDYDLFQQMHSSVKESNLINGLINQIKTKGKCYNQLCCNDKYEINKDNCPIGKIDKCKPYVAHCYDKVTKKKFNYPCSNIDREFLFEQVFGGGKYNI